MCGMHAFRTPAAFRQWLKQHHDSADELPVLFFKKDSGRGGITYAEALHEALCYGWIDGVRKGVDADSYTIRFTPRKPRSIWSRVNVGHVERLIREGRMQPAGLKAFAAREQGRTGVYSFENRPDRFSPELERPFKAANSAWAFFQAQPPGYRRIVTWWVISAKKPETRQKRLARLIEVSAAGRRVDLLKPMG